MSIFLYLLLILPICDDFIIAVGKSDDDTLELIKNIDPSKIKIIETTWDENKREGGEVLAIETNKAFDAISQDTDWCFYIQGDEVIHEQYLDIVKQAMKENLNNKLVDGLLFKYIHFYGSYDYTGNSRQWYRREIRIIRNNKSIRSYKDAQGFRKIKNNQSTKLKVRLIDAYIYHYGWVKHPKFQQAKQETFNKLWHDDNWMKQNIDDVDEFDYSQIDSLAKFTGTHPKVMQKRIQSINWKFSFDPTKKKPSLKNRISQFIEKYTGYRIGEYKNYKII